MKNASSLYQSDIVVKKEPRSYWKSRTMVNDILEQQQQNMLIAQKEQCTLFERSRRKANIVALGRQKARARNAENFLLNMTGLKKGKGKGNRSSVRVVFLCKFIHCDALLLGPANFELRVTKNWISLERIVNSIIILFDTSLPRVVGHKILFLCVGFCRAEHCGVSLS